MTGWWESLRRRLGTPRRAGEPSRRAKPIFETEIVIADGAELAGRLREQGLDPGEIVFKYGWPRYAPPPDAGIRSLVKSEHLRPQFDRLLAMHAIVQSRVPMPLAAVLSPEREFIGYLLEFVPGVTLQELIDDGMLDEARRQLARVEEAIEKLHARSVAHGDVNTSNVIAADDGRTLLIDPIPFPQPGTLLQDDLCLRQIRELIG